jgi:two-component system OmpR family sensor kinase
MILRWLPILAPAILGLIISTLYNQSAYSNPVIVLRMDLSVFIFIFGILLSSLAGIGLLVNDWVERRHIQSLVEAAQERRRFLSRLDHELKNPLTAILAAMANLRSAESDKEREQSIYSVETQMSRMRTLIGDLRKLADLETRAIELEPVETAQILQENFKLIKERTEASQRAWNLSIPQAPWPLPAVLADRDLLFLAVHNLIDNALKFSNPGDTIELRAYEDSSNVVIEVADTGPGIPEDELPQVWNELYRGASARGVPGSGLGLALVRAIVNRHHGKVTVRSRSGQGTVFSIQIPAADVTKR